jgi:hypothetical protein
MCVNNIYKDWVILRQIVCKVCFNLSNFTYILKINITVSYIIKLHIHQYVNMCSLSIVLILEYMVENQ